MHRRAPLDIVVAEQRLSCCPAATTAPGRRNPLYATVDPPASGRCPIARGPSASRRRSSDQAPPHFVSRSGSSDNFSISAVGTAIEDGKPD